MYKHIVSGGCACVLALSAWAQAPAPGALATPTVRLPSTAAASAPVAAAAAAAPAEQILIVGQRPGPGLWKVSKGGHVLWLFGTYSPLPKKLEWRSHEVEAIIGRSQEFLQAPSSTASVGWFRQLTLLPYAIGIQENPDGARLHDLLPAEVYARWLPLRKKYLNDDTDYERYRPLFAAELLFSKGLQQAGLSNGGEVGDAIAAIVQRAGIKTTSSNVQLPIDDPVRMIKEFKKSPIDAAACFAATLDRLETDIDAMRARANAWAKGDLAGIRALSFADRDQACGAAMLDSAFAKSQPGLMALRARMREAWLASAEQALAANLSTFGVLKLQTILAPDGIVEALRAKGYTVEAPE